MAANDEIRMAHSAGVQPQLSAYFERHLCFGYGFFRSSQAQIEQRLLA